MERATALSCIEALKYANCRTLTLAMNNYWTPVAFKNTDLDVQKMVTLIKKIKENSLSMVKICQEQSTTVPWERVPSRKRGPAPNPYSNKRTCIRY